MEKTYVAIDLKSFYASVECVERGLDPLGVNLVVADSSRTEKTICLAVSPALKAFGIPGRARLFEVIEKIRQVNASRREKAPGRKFREKSYVAKELEKDPSLELDFLIAPPQMAHYMEVSTAIYGIYLQFVSPEDIHVYSVDEVFIDATRYLKTYGTSPREFAAMLIHQVLEKTGITATAGIGTNLYLAKVAMDIVAKHITPDRNGVRIAELDEKSYRLELWNHRPLTDFWRVGRGISRRLEKAGLYTMGDIARCSLGKPGEWYNEDLLYRLFGVNAELLIDHAWGWEPTTIAAIKAYKPESNSLSSGQVLSCPYDFAKGRLIVREMTDLLVLDLVEKGLVTDQMVLTVGYDTSGAEQCKDLVKDGYGRKVPKAAHGSVNLGGFTASTKTILKAVTGLYEDIVDPRLPVRRMYVVANHVRPEAEATQEFEQLDLFSAPESDAKKQAAQEKERRQQQAVLEIRKKFGKNAILKGMNFEEGATTRQRNGQVGGHKA